MNRNVSDKTRSAIIVFVHSNRYEKYNNFLKTEKKERMSRIKEYGFDPNFSHYFSIPKEYDLASFFTYIHI